MTPGLGVDNTDLPTGKGIPPAVANSSIFCPFSDSIVPTLHAKRVSGVRDLRLRQAAEASAAPKPFIGFGDPDFAGLPGDLRGLVRLAKACRADKAIDVDDIRDLPQEQDDNSYRLIAWPRE
jgi:hypothetical protein